MSERKPKERKPLFQPGSVLGGETDILGSVLTSYAQSTGQPAPVLRQEEPSPLAADAETPVEREEEPSAAAERPEPTARSTEPARQPADKPARQPRASRPKKSASAEEDAQNRAQTPKRLCSYRIPEGLDDWLEEYAFQHRHTGMKKQDLVAQAIQLLIVSRAAPLDAEEDQS